MKTCSFDNQINAYLDGELSGAKLRSFEAHLQACPQCREEVEQFRGLLTMLHGAGDKEVPPALHQRLHDALSNEIAKGDGRVKRKLNPWALTAVAAALVIVVTIGALASGGGIGMLQSKAGGDKNNMDLYGGTSTAQIAGDDGYAEEEKGFGAAEAPMEAPAAMPEADRGEVTRNATADKNLAASNAQRLNQPADGRKIIYTAYMVVETREFDKSMTAVADLLNKYGGYKEYSQESGVPDENSALSGRTAVISIRLPIQSYGQAIADMQTMGNVLSKNESTEDVSRQYVDTEARNKTLILQRDKLYELLEKADTMEGIIALQNEITRLTVEIEQMTAQLRFWDDKVAYSTITVELRELVTPKTIKPVDPDLNTRMGGALNSTLNNMKKGMEDFAVRFVGFLPWLAILLLIAGALSAVLIPVMHRTRRSAKKADGSKQKEE